MQDTLFEMLKIVEQRQYYIEHTFDTLKESESSSITIIICRGCSLAEFVFHQDKIGLYSRVALKF